MNESKKYLIDVIELMPLNSMWLIYSVDEEIENKIQNISFIKNDVDYVILLNGDNREKLVKAVNENNLNEFIQQNQFKFEDKLLFEGYDYMEFGTISKDIKLPEAFVERYVKGDMCIISSEW